ncbi:AAA family ATPase [Carboxylicivirga marina]|uniref:AAA family ATPase n=1 Tax=Carboxylicivirga marina TaxID=2800988 RepID=UPI002593876B|nr:AAA family ATPase [uncultured Carboxylicivirga sp.]
MAFIKVIRGSYNGVTKNHKAADFYLETDDWNDYGYRTLYHLSLSGKHTDDGEPSQIGSVKILQLGQESDMFHRVNLGKLDRLDDTFCSLGMSLDYYNRIAQLKGDLGTRLLSALRDTIHNNKIKTQFNNEDGWNTSLLRGFDKDDEIFKLAPFILSKQYDQFPRIDLSFSFQTEGMSKPMKFNFDSPKYGPNKSESLPNRIAVVIGRNGSGKSTILSKMARICFASTVDREKTALNKVGKISPKGIGFPQLINISYSAFDSFRVPGIYKKEKEQIAKEIDKGIGRYMFCGIRDVSKELIETMSLLNFGKDGRLCENDIIEDKQTNTLLKPISKLATEFVRAIEKIRNDNDKKFLFRESFETLIEEPSLKSEVDNNLLGMDKDMLSDYFMKLSTGHKFVLHSLCNIIANVEMLSLVLFDEPETHLHPPLLAILMKAIRYVLNEKNAFMVLATHSPVVLQETLSSHVYIVRREGQMIEIKKPEIQTYGENIGIITSHVFNLTSDYYDFHDELDNVLKYFSNNSKNSDKVFSRIEKLFNDDISMQARAYLLSRIND